MPFYAAHKVQPLRPVRFYGFGHHGAREHAHDGTRGVEREGHVLCGHRLYVHGARHVRDVGGADGEQRLSVLGDERAVIEHLFHPLSRYVRADEEIRRPARSDRARILYAVRLVGVERGYRDRVDRIHAALDRQPHRVAYRAEADEIFYVAVVGAEQEAAQIGLVHRFYERAEIARLAALAYEHVHALAHLFQRLFHAFALVVGGNPRGDVRVQRVARHSGRVTVDNRAHVQLGQHVGVAADHAGKIHHLAQPEQPA